MLVKDKNLLKIPLTATNYNKQADNSNTSEPSK